MDLDLAKQIPQNSQVVEKERHINERQTDKETEKQRERDRDRYREWVRGRESLLYLNLITYSLLIIET